MTLVKGDVTIVTIWESKPLVMTQHTAILIDHSTEDTPLVISNNNVVPVFISRTL